MVTKFKFVLAACLAGLAALLLPLAASAMTTPTTYKGLSITPAIEQITISKEPSKTFRVRVDNNQPYNVALSLSSIDFRSLDETGGLAFISSSSAAELQNKYGLAKWLSLPSGSITLPANGGRFINVTVRNDSSLTPGGHYGAILFKADNPGAGSSNNIQSNPVVSSLIFVRKTGGEVYSINLTQAILNRSHGVFGWPTSISLLISNAGNVQTAPEGSLTLGTSTKPVNINSSLVLPGSSRWINENLFSQKPFLPGIYHYKFIYHPDFGGSSKTYTASFVYIGWPFIVAAVILLLGLALALILGRKVRKKA